MFAHFDARTSRVMSAAAPTSRLYMADHLDASGASDLGEAPRRLRGASPPRPGSAGSRTPASPLDRPMGGGARAASTASSATRSRGAGSSWRRAGLVVPAPWRHIGARPSSGNFPGETIKFTEITCPRWRRARHDGLLVHESLVLDDIDTTVRERIPVTTAPRTLFDLAGVVGPTTVDMAVATALRRQLTTLVELEEVFARLASRGRAGTMQFRAVLELHRATPAQTESEAEHLILRLIAKHGLPAPVPQYEIRRPDGSLRRARRLRVPGPQDRDRVRQLCPPPRHGSSRP